MQTEENRAGCNENASSWNLQSTRQLSFESNTYDSEIAANQLSKATGPEGEEAPARDNLEAKDHPTAEHR